MNNAKIPKNMKKVVISLLVMAICVATIPFMSMNVSASTITREVYAPQTGLVNPPTVIQNIDSSAKMKALSSSVRAQGAWFYIASSGKALVGNSEVALADIFAACSKAIPYLQLADQSAANSVSAYIKSNNITDLVLVSDNTTVVKSLADMNIAYTRLALISSLTDKAAISRTAHTCGASIVILSNADRATAEYLQKRFLSVSLKPKLSDEGRVRAAVDCGANSVVVNTIERAYEMYSQITAQTYVRRAFTVAHRGRNTVAPENTVESLQEAIKVNSDAVECDVYVTSDGDLVVNHNGNISGYTTNTSANGNIEKLTRAQIKEYTLKTVGNYANCKFAFLDEFFTVLADHPDVTLVIEIKTSNSTVSQKIYDLAKKMNMLDNIVIISFNAGQLTTARKVMPQVGASLLGYYSGDVATVTQKVMSSVCADSIDISPEHTLTKEAICALSYRGISVNSWTLGSYTDMVAEAQKGATFLTTNACNAANSVNKVFGAMSAQAMWGDYTEPEVTVVYGDANEDGTVNALDLLVIKKYCVFIPVKINLENTDVNADGKYNALDLLMIKKHIVGIPLAPWTM